MHAEDLKVSFYAEITNYRRFDWQMLEKLDQSQASFQIWEDSSSVRSMTLPRRHRRQVSGDLSGILANFTPRSTRRNRSPCSSLPRSKCSSLSRCTSRTSVVPCNNQHPHYQQKEKNSTYSSPSCSGDSFASVRRASHSKICGNSGSDSGITDHNSITNCGSVSDKFQNTRHLSRRIGRDNVIGESKATNGFSQHKVFTEPCIEDFF